MYVSIGRYKIHGEGHSRWEGDQLDVTLELLAQDGYVVVHPHPPVLDIERESSFDDPQVDRDGDTIIAPVSASDLELGKERKFSISTDIEGLVSWVSDDDDLPKPVVSDWAQEHRHIQNYRDGEGPKDETYFVGLPDVTFAVYIAVLGGEDMNVFSICTFRNLVVAIEPLADWNSSGYCDEQGSCLAVRNTHCLDLVPARGWSDQGREGIKRR